MSKFFSVDSSWCLTGYCVLMATEVSYYSGVFCGIPSSLFISETCTSLLFLWKPGQLVSLAARASCLGSAGNAQRCWGVQEASAPVVHLSQTPGEARQPEFAGGSWTQVGMARSVCP